MTEKPDPERSAKPRKGSASQSVAGNQSARPAENVLQSDNTQLPSLKPLRRAAVLNDAANTPAANSIALENQAAPIIPVDNEFELVGQHQSHVELISSQAFVLQPLSDPSTEPISLQQRLRRNRYPLSSVLVSMLAHVGLFLLLIFIVFGIPEPIPRISVLAEFDANPVLENPADVELKTMQIDIPDDHQSPIEMTFNDISNQLETKIAESPSSVINSVAEQNNPTTNDIEAPAHPKQTMPTGGGLEGRESTARARLAASRGGSRASEMAVEQGLHWILAHQREDGSWRFHHQNGDCDGRCANPGLRESTTAATGLALMSLLGAGYTHRSGPYQEQVGKGINYLLEKIRYTDHGGILAEGEKKMYSQAIATIALAEAYTMTHDTSLIAPVDEARKYIVTAQSGNGSWGYNPGQPGDLTLTGWQLMALKSCRLAGLATEAAVFEKAEAFVDSLGSSSGCYGYKTPEEGNPTTTSIGLLSKMYLGMHKEHGMLESGSGFIFDKGPSETDVYFDYYATQVLCHLQGPNWKTWNQEMRDHLINTQVRSQGHDAGSWYFEDQHGVVGGRLYTTAMSVMILEVYYRFMPLYEEKAIEAENVGKEPFLR